jgi:hypothetical protein
MAPGVHTDFAGTTQQYEIRDIIKQDRNTNRKKKKTKQTSTKLVGTTFETDQ